MTTPPVTPIADVDRTQGYTLTASTPYVDLAYPLFGDASDIKVYLDDAEITAWSLVSISGGDVSTMPRPLTDGRILFVTPPTSGDLEIVYRWRPRQTNLSEASGIGRREFNLTLAQVTASLRETYRDLRVIDGLLRDLDALGLTPGAAGPLAERSTYNAQGEGFVFLATDDASGAPVVYVKVSNTLGDWSAGMSIRGAKGDPGEDGYPGMRIVNAAGTADAITASLTPALTSWVNGQTILIRHGAANTSTTPTINPGPGAKTIVKGANSALLAGDIPGAGFWGFYTYDSALDRLVMANPALGNGSLTAVYSDKRQTVMDGPVDSSGNPSFLPATATGLDLTSQNLTSVALIVGAAMGYAATGEANRIGRSALNLTWASLPNGSTSFLGVTVATNGALTPFHTTTAPVYQWGGTPSTTSGQYTFVISRMRMYLGDGSAANEVAAVFVGEAVTSGGNVTATVAYAYRGMSERTDGSNLPTSGGAVTHNHNVGTLVGLEAKIELVCQTIDFGYSVGDVVENPLGGNASWASPISLRKGRNSLVVRAANLSSNTWGAQNASTGAFALGLDVANWRIRTRVWRAW
jgi:hypothetical protein